MSTASRVAATFLINAGEPRYCARCGKRFMWPSEVLVYAQVRDGHVEQIEAMEHTYHKVNA